MIVDYWFSISDCQFPIECVAQQLRWLRDDLRGPELALSAVEGCRPWFQLFLTTGDTKKYEAISNGKLPTEKPPLRHDAISQEFDLFIDLQLLSPCLGQQRNGNNH